MPQDPERPEPTGLTNRRRKTPAADKKPPSLQRSNAASNLKNMVPSQGGEELRTEDQSKANTSSAGVEKDGEK